MNIKPEGVTRDHQIERSQNQSQIQEGVKVWTNINDLEAQTITIQALPGDIEEVEVLLLNTHIINTKNILIV